MNKNKKELSCELNYGYRIFDEYGQLLDEYSPGNADLIAEKLSKEIESFESDFDEILPEEDLNYVIKQSIEILFIARWSDKYRKRNAHLKAVINRYRKKFNEDLGGRQTPCIVDGIYARPNSSISTELKGVGEYSKMILEGLEGLLKHLIVKVYTLFSWRVL